VAKGKSAKRNDVERRIHFYRADCGRDKESGKLIAFQPTGSLAHIKKLKFEVGGRYYEFNENTYCCWVDSNAKVRFAVIRRDAFPTTEEKGIIKALNLPEAAGLVEQIHVRFFPNNIVGTDFNFYGPRLGRLASYLNDLGGGKSDKVVFEPLLRRDTASELDKKQEIRLFGLRIRRSEVERIKQIDSDLGSAFEGVAKVSDASELEVVLRPKAYSRRSMGKKLLAKAKKLAKNDSIREIASDFHVKVANPGEPSMTVDILGDHFISERRILKQTVKGRALDSDDAYAQIDDAYNERRDDLRKAAAFAEEAG
jgi:hypothetical protein